MKALKLITLTFILLTSISCKKEQQDTEVITVDTTEEVTTKKIAANATLVKTKFTIDGMTCQVGCANKIEKSLTNMEGVANAKVDFESKTAIVEHDVDKVTTDLLATRVVANGAYKASNFKTTTAKKCSSNCSKSCCKKEIKKCATDCKKECCIKNKEEKTCKPDCEKACCKENV